ncbi:MULTISPECIES: hypothetical protein [Acinetobacter]|uniref:Uncharacterized protein n=1 Tax=Acinetobacter higginsii TaxID=70347 RepID=N9RI38_9GAMM|nr:MULTISPECIES: hypothetical protein [Acinetobacter]ENX57614.1 hypothetical protein F902_02011 [Acinetobacter higginsii]
MNEKPIAEVHVSGSFEGSPEDAANHIFSTLIAPIAEQLKKVDPKDSNNFVYHIMGLGITQFSESVCPEHFRKILNDVVEVIATEMEKDRTGIKH